MSLTFGCGRYQSSAIGDSTIRSVVYALGHKKLHIVLIDFPVRVVSLPREEFRYITPLQLDGAPYPLDHAIKQVHRAIVTHGVTQRAKNLLDYALSSTTIDEEELDSMTNEESLPQEAEGSEAETTNQPTKQENGMTTKAKKTPSKKAAAPKKAATKKTAKKTTDKGPSRISQAVEYMREEVKKEGGQKNLERGWRKELFERAAKKFDLSPTTCSIQYNKQVLNKGK